MAKVPNQIMRTAKARIQVGSRKLQQSFAEARSRLSMGDRRSTGSPQSSFSDSEQNQNSDHHSHQHHNHFRLHFPSMRSSSANSMDESEQQHHHHHLLGFFGKRFHSHGSSDGDGVEGGRKSASTQEKENNTGLERIEGRLSQSFQSRSSSVVSSTGSFCSVDELPMEYLNEEDEDKLSDEEREKKKMPGEISEGGINPEKSRKNEREEISVGVGQEQAGEKSHAKETKCGDSLNNLASEELPNTGIQAKGHDTKERSAGSTNVNENKFDQHPHDKRSSETVKEDDDCSAIQEKAPSAPMQKANGKDPAKKRRKQKNHKNANCVIQ